MSECLPQDKVKSDGKIKMEDILKTLDKSDIGLFFDVGLSYPCNIGETTRNFPFAPENMIFNPYDFTPYMKKIKPNS